MNKKKFKRKNLKVEKEMKENLEKMDISRADDEAPPDQKAEVTEEDLKIFILNNLLMGVQFFENFERDIKIMRENWFKEITLQEHFKKCFYADSLLKLVGSNVKFRPIHGSNKNTETLLHPLRIFISDKRLIAAYDPESLRKVKSSKPYHQLTVKPCENNKKDKSGYVFLVEFKIPEKTTASILKNSDNSPVTHQIFNRSSTNELIEKKTTRFQKKSALDLSRSRRKLTKTEKIIGLQSKNLISENQERRSSLIHFLATNEYTIPQDGFYNYMQPLKKLESKPINEFRMNSTIDTPQALPRKCFQTVEVKNNTNSQRRGAVKRTEGEACFRTQTLLNSAAFKGYFCDELFEKLIEPLGLDFNAADEGLVREEYVIINQKGVENYIVPVVQIVDWNKHVEIIQKPKNNKQINQIEWPNLKMRKIINVLPCYAVPKGHLEESEENLDFEKEWKLDFPKVEEFLLMHMMHAHIRCYFFALAIYKTFIEVEVNCGSFGPKHLLHLLFWMVQQDFLGWPEDRPGETLLNFFKILYKKLQNKSLRDFFITPRNLFADSLVKDLHKAQTIIKRILENPVPYILRAVRNLSVEPNFFQSFDISKLNEVIIKSTTANKPEKPLKKVKILQDQNKDQTTEQKRKRVRFEDKEQQWMKNVIKQINLEKKAEEEEQVRKLSIDSINLEDFPQMTLLKDRHQQIVEIFLSHFLKMGMKSTEYLTLDQALMYFYQIQKLLKMNICEKLAKDVLLKIKESTNELQKQCDKLANNFSSMNLKRKVESDKKPEKPNEEDLIKCQDTIVIEIVDKREETKINNIIYSEVMETKL